MNPFKTRMLVILGAALVLIQSSWAEMPKLPKGGQTRWIVDDVHEVVCYTMFNPAEHLSLLPESYRFVTLEEIAMQGMSWARDYLKDHPTHQQWGISFLEIVQTKTFLIDGEAPNWPPDGAVALWCARLAPRHPKEGEVPGPHLMLDLWVPDSDYVQYMRQKGHYASFGEVRLKREVDGSWVGTVQTDDLSITTMCRPDGPIIGGSQSAGAQTFFPPAPAAISRYVQVVSAGHRIQDCSEESFWRITGSHPLVSSVVVPPSTYQFGYSLSGSAFNFCETNSMDKAEQVKGADPDNACR